jgi:hypothetical protein
MIPIKPRVGEHLFPDRHSRMRRKKGSTFLPEFGRLIPLLLVVAGTRTSFKVLGISG